MMIEQITDLVSHFDRKLELLILCLKELIPLNCQTHNLQFTDKGKPEQLCGIHMLGTGIVNGKR